jgi:DNA-binding MarR family transcriptional regulator
VGFCLHSNNRIGFILAQEILLSNPYPISKTEYEILAEFRFALRRFTRFSDTAVGEVGLTPQQHQALLAIRGFPGREQITIGELAERLQIKHHSAVGLVNRLEAEGLIDRSTAPHDRRKVFISLTQRGLSILEKLSSTHREELLWLSPQLRLLLEQITRLSESGN